MSRHRGVRAYSWDDDEGYDDDQDEDYIYEQKLYAAMDQVYEIIGDGFSEKEVERALVESELQIELTVALLLGHHDVIDAANRQTQAPHQPSPKPPKSQKGNKGPNSSGSAASSGSGKGKGGKKNKGVNNGAASAPAPLNITPVPKSVKRVVEDESDGAASAPIVEDSAAGAGGVGIRIGLPPRPPVVSPKSQDHQRVVDTAQGAAEKLSGITLDGGGGASSPSVVWEAEEEDEQGVVDQLAMVVVGHVDAGKSTLMGGLLYRLGHVNQRLMHKYEKQAREVGKASFALAWVMDENEEERARGVTMDVGQRSFVTPSGKRVTLLDAPGHRDFIPAMIQGAAQADVAVLVVPAPPNEFDSAFASNGQTKEHTLVVRALGVAQMVVAINKMDMVEWSESQFQAVVAGVTAHLRASGFKTKNITFVPVSGLSSENVATRSEESRLVSWYTGPSLLEAIDNFTCPPRQVARPFRLTVADVYADVLRAQSLGSTVVSGKVASGHIRVGSELLVMPCMERCAVRGIRSHDESALRCRAGDLVELGLSGIDPAVLSNGFVLCDPRAMVPVVTKFRAQIRTLPVLEVPLIEGRMLSLHINGVEVPATVGKLVSAKVARGGREVEIRKPRAITRNMTAVLTVRCSKPVCAEKFADCRPLGRVLLRDRGVTLAAGLVLKLLKSD